jgi:hypothetical protein
MTQSKQDTPKTPTILIYSTSKSAYSIFNSNAWEGNSKPIITSCGAQYSLLQYQVTKLPSLIRYSQEICEARFMELKNHWGKSPWDINRGDYLVEVPEFHLHVQSFLATIKTFLDLIVQLISTEGIVAKTVHGFHKKGKQVGGEVLQILETKARPEKSNTAGELFKLIDGQKTAWIDQAVNVRDILVHPVNGLAQVMFRLEIGQKKGELKLLKIIQPSLAGVQFDEYSHMTLMHIDNFSKSYVDIMKAA